MASRQALGPHGLYSTSLEHGAAGNCSTAAEPAPGAVLDAALEQLVKVRSSNMLPSAARVTFNQARRGASTADRCQPGNREALRSKGACHSMAQLNNHNATQHIHVCAACSA